MQSRQICAIFTRNTTNIVCIYVQLLVAGPKNALSHFEFIYFDTGYNSKLLRTHYCTFILTFHSVQFLSDLDYLLKHGVYFFQNAQLTKQFFTILSIELVKRSF